MNNNVKYFFNRLYDKLANEDTLGNAAQVAFYFSFSLFPLLLFLISLFGLVLESANDFRLELFAYLRRIMPVSAYELVFNTMSEVIEKSSGGKITLGILIAVWSSSAGLDALRNALNEVYRIRESRPYWKTKPQSLGLTLIIGILVFVALGIIFYGSHFIVWSLAKSNLPIPSPFFVGALKWVTIFSLLLFAFALLYNALPDRKIYRWQWITPGAIVAIALWLIASNGFRAYLAYFDSYSKTYGSLGAMIILMFWLYITAVVIIVGAITNQILEEIYNKLRVVSESQAILSGNPAKASEPDNSILSAFIPEKTSSSNQKIAGESEPAETISKEENTLDEKEHEEKEHPDSGTKTSEAETSVVKTPGSKEKIAVKKPAEVSAASKSQPKLHLNSMKEIKTVSQTKTEKISASSIKNSKKPLISLTIVGVFGVLMGLMFRNKPDKK